MLLFCVSVLGAGRLYHPGGDCNVTVLSVSVLVHTVLVGCIILVEIVMLLLYVSVLGAGRMYHPGGDCNVTVLCFSTRCWSVVSSWGRL